MAKQTRKVSAKWIEQNRRLFREFLDETFNRSCVDRCLSKLFS
jgi:hypothetical protein